MFSEVASVECAECTPITANISSDISDTDFDEASRNKLTSLITEVENSNFPPVADDFAVKIKLKDDSTFAYAPRRFSISERREIRKITDDLLVRGIIKVSSSPYCSRIVPVRKKDGSLRLCVDLRPLNDRVEKQKFPFPVIEDILTYLKGKSVFSLIDLKDGFHLLKLHHDHTKYFAFATPDGQFEYLRLPFGYCENISKKTKPSFATDNPVGENKRIHE